MSSDSDQTKKSSILMKLVLPVVTGFLLTWCLTIIVNYFQYGKNLVKLDSNLDEYKIDECIPPDEAKQINTMQNLKWSIIPAIFNLIIWGGLIWFVTRSPTNSDDNEPVNA